MIFDSKCSGGSTRAHLLAGAALAALVASILPAAGQNATWNATATVAGPTPSTFDFNAPANWTPNAAPIGPTGTAFFGATTTQNLSFSAPATLIDGWTFNVGASAYTFTNEQLIFFNGAGILINGGSATITNNGLGGIIIFRNFSTAGSATYILQTSIINFADHSTAGSATFYNNGAIGFSGSSRADNATFINNNAIVFFDSSSGSTARFINGTGGYIDLSLLTNAGMTAGSIEGAGNINLAAKNLAVGGNSLSTTFAGVLQRGRRLAYQGRRRYPDAVRGQYLHRPNDDQRGRADCRRLDRFLCAHRGQQRRIARRRRHGREHADQRRWNVCAGPADMRPDQ